MFGDDKPILTDIANRLQNHIKTDEELKGHTVLTVHEVTILLN